MNNSHAILIQILGIAGSTEPTSAAERTVDDFLTFVQMQVMAGLIEALPAERQNKIIDQFINVPDSPQKAEQIFSPYYTQEYMREKLKKATKKAIVEHFVEPQSERLTPSERDSILDAYVLRSQGWGFLKVAYLSRLQPQCCPGAIKGP